MKKLLFLLSVSFFACKVSISNPIENNNKASEERIFLGLESSVIYENNINYISYELHNNRIKLYL